MKIFTILTFSIFFASCSNPNFSPTDTSTIQNDLSNVNDNNQQLNQPDSMSLVKTIENPLILKYNYWKKVKLEDGESAEVFIEEGKINDSSRNYIWSKTIPLSPSSEVKYLFEYQMACSDQDFKLLETWIAQNMGTNLATGTTEKTNWYTKGMSLSEVYGYCKENQTDFSIILYNKADEKMATIYFNCSGSEIEKEIALLLTILTNQS